MRRRGGGHKRKLRLIDFKRDKFDMPAEVKSIQYDPNRTAFIALLEYKDGEKRYIIAPNGLQVGQKVLSGEKTQPEIGNAMRLSEIPLGTIISCIELVLFLNLLADCSMIFVSIIYHCFLVSMTYFKLGPIKK